MKIVILLVSFCIVSCRYYTEPDLQTNSPYQGEWFGDYSGDDNGEIFFKVSPKGHITGMRKPVNSNASEEFIGYVLGDGKFSANTKTNFSIDGFITLNESRGVWKQIPYKGIFYIQKK
ncbi:hypothetical protein BAX97_07765 [Elizabethkingia meningoseptica]|uniref:hypothetical protein n=1 Tax=Elizabethkingia meningoseptica TaxID=238 RepID=UPI0009376CEE|nr:hypothetical protein [Elizabethkingia meningoseptica]MDE5488132.1 hypothetical protein [Elizabethkingia meningoseptica]MVW91142.1 hypothetical protein [Elizabethkingia meningoseptica]OPC27827.1 hypothetical protein BAX97_07765 [Elizabethkingia meningoseptica]